MSHKTQTAPRVSPADIEANIVHTAIVKHISQSGQVLRWAVLTTRNGHAVTGRPSACVSPENDQQDLGEKIAIENAKSDLWALMGYALKEEIFNNHQLQQKAALPYQQRVIDEKAEIDQRATALSTFIGENPIFETVAPDEQERMREQCELMWSLSEVLGKRISAFNS